MRHPGSKPPPASVPTPFQRFADLTKRLLAVPKNEIEKQRVLHDAARKKTRRR